MSNPTELPDMDKLQQLADDLDGNFQFGAADTLREIINNMRRAQPEGIGIALREVTDKLAATAAENLSLGMENRKLRDQLAERAQQAEAPGATGGFAWLPLEPTEAMVHAAEDLPAPRMFGKVWRAMAGAAHSAPGTPEAPKPPFPISDDEMAALRRFWECATDGEGYDVEKPMMQRLAEMGLVQRKSGAYYMTTDFGLYVLGEYTIQRAAQLDGGQEGSAT